MKFYFIRHWRTEANLTGKMAKNYDEADIIDEYPEGWEDRVGCHIPDRNYILSSPAKRCLQTCELLFKRAPTAIMKDFGEFDCAALGKRKFWEMTQAAFEKLVKLKPEDMEKRVYSVLTTLPVFLKNEGIENCVVISHGMFIRYVYHYLTGNKGISAYDVINSKGFEFSNLDMLVYDTETKQVEVYHYDDKKMFC